MASKRKSLVAAAITGFVAIMQRTSLAQPSSMTCSEALQLVLLLKANDDM
jgi:hypothetical protein